MNFLAYLGNKNKRPKLLYFLEFLGHSNHGSAVVEVSPFFGRSAIYRPERSKPQICIFFAFMIVSENRTNPLDFLAFLGQKENGYWIVDFLAFLVTAFPYITLLILTHI